MTACIVYLTVGGFLGLALGATLAILWTDNCTDCDNCTCFRCEELRREFTDQRTEG